ADGQPAEVVRRVQVGDQGLERSVGVTGRRRDGVEDGVEEGGEVVVGPGQAHALHRAALPGDGRHHLEHEVVGGGGQVHEQVLDLVEDLVGTGVGPVDLVQHHH